MLVPMNAARMPGFMAKFVYVCFAFASLSTLSNAKLFWGSKPPVAPAHGVTVDEHVSFNHSDINLLYVKSESTLKSIDKLVLQLIDPNDTPCSKESLARLSATCKGLHVEAVSDNPSARTLENVNSVYGIRRAVCETHLTGTEIPPSCKPILPISSSDMSYQRLIRSELEIADSSSLLVCVRDLQREHFLWTSYSNNLQQAGTVCNLFRTEVDLGHLVLHFKDLHNVVSSFYDDLSGMRDFTAQWHQEVFADSQILFDVQNQVLKTAQDSNATLESIFSMALELHDILESRTQTVSNGLDRMKSELGEWYGSAALQLTSLVQDASKELEVLDTQIHSALNQTSNIIDAQQKQFALSNVTLELQVATHERAGQAYDILRATAEIASELQGKFGFLTPLIARMEKYTDAAVVLITFAALAAVLYPVQLACPASRVPFAIMSTFWIYQAFIYLIQQLDLSNKTQMAIRFGGRLAKTDHVFRSLVLLIIILSGASFAAIALATRQKDSPNKPDIENFPCMKQQKSFDPLRKSWSQRRRTKKTSLRSYAASTPPGL